MALQKEDNLAGVPCEGTQIPGAQSAANVKIRLRNQLFGGARKKPETVPWERSPCVEKRARINKGVKEA